MTAHEKECALAAIAARIEVAKTTKVRNELKKIYREIIETQVSP